jgi:hypothetical protein
MRTLLVLLLLVAGAAEAQQKAVVPITVPGTYLISTDAAGGISIERVAAIAVGGGVVPVPTPDPVPVPVDDRAQVTRDLIMALPASDARHQNAIKFAGTLRLLADQTKNGTLPQDMIARVYGPLMAVAVSDSSWKHVHAAVLEGLGSCPSPAVCAAALDQYAAGAMATVPNKAEPGVMRSADGDEIAAAAEEYGFDWSKLFEMLLPILLALLKSFIG